MADLSVEIVAALGANAGVAALVGSRIYPQWRPQDNGTFPQLVYGITREAIRSLTGDSLASQGTISVRCLAKTNAGAVELAEAVRLALGDRRGALGSIESAAIQYRTTVEDLTTPLDASGEALYGLTVEFYAFWRVAAYPAV